MGAASAVLAVGLPTDRLPARVRPQVRLPRTLLFALHLALVVSSEANLLNVSGGPFSQFLYLAARVRRGPAAGGPWVGVTSPLAFRIAPG